jgi:hypothetical protein
MMRGGPLDPPPIIVCLAVIECVYAVCRPIAAHFLKAPWLNDPLVSWGSFVLIALVTFLAGWLIDRSP